MHAVNAIFATLGILGFGRPYVPTICLVSLSLGVGDGCLEDLANSEGCCSDKCWLSLHDPVFNRCLSFILSAICQVVSTIPANKPAIDMFFNMYQRCLTGQNLTCQVHGGVGKGEWDGHKRYGCIGTPVELLL